MTGDQNTVEIQIFRTGTQTATDGRQVNFSAADLAACAANYDPRAFDAPIVIGHPKTNHPAYGWVQGMTARGNKLFATVKPIAEAVDLVRKGAFKKVSASFFLSGADNNPKPGAPYLRHVGLLGAAAPALPGLPAISFAADDDDDGIVTFADWDQLNVIGIFRKLRDFLIEKFGADEADKVLDADQLDWMQNSAAQEPDDSASPSLTYAAPQDNAMTNAAIKAAADLEAQRADLARREQVLAAQTAEFAARDQAARKVQDEAFIADLVKQGRIVPAIVPEVVTFMSHLDHEGIVTFAEGDGAPALTPRDWFKQLLAKSGQVVDFSERARAEAQSPADIADFAAPPGAQVDPDRLDLHRRAQAYAAQKGVDYLTAVRAVEKL